MAEFQFNPGDVVTVTYPSDPSPRDSELGWVGGGEHSYDAVVCIVDYDARLESEIVQVEFCVPVLLYNRPEMRSTYWWCFKHWIEPKHGPW